MSNQNPHISSYEKGMNKDINVESMPPNVYEDAQNFRLFTTGAGATVGGIHNIKGTTLSYSFVNEFERVIGYTQLRDSLVLFTAVSTEEPDTGRIYQLRFNFINDTVSVELIYESDDLQFTAAAPIEAIAVYENSFYQRVYWSDFTRPTRTINIADPNVQDLPVSSLDLFPSPPLRKPQIEFISEGGELPSGLYNFSYYLVTPGGQKTLLAPVSNQVHIIEASESAGSTGNYQGTFAAPGNTIFTTKSVNISVDTSELEPNQFSQIVYVAIYLNEMGGVPTIYEFKEEQLSGANEVNATHFGSEPKVLIPFEDFLSERYPFYTNKTFSIKDDTLFVANVKTQGLILTPNQASQLITRRYTNTQETYQDPYNNPFNDESGTVFGTNANGSYETWIQNYQYMFQSDGATIGGEAPFIRYTFTLEAIRGMDLDTNISIPTITSIENIQLNDQYTESNSTFQNFASPYKRFLRGYKRGEVYRFGIIFFDSVSNLPSPVYFIGDIKFPELSQPFGQEYPSGVPIINPQSGQPTGETFDHYAVAKASEGNTSQLYTLGLEFSFSFPQEILDSISGFQIVRVPRTQNDRTRLGQGIINKYYNIDAAELKTQENGGANWPERENEIETFCPISELSNVFGHLNRYLVHDNFEGPNSGQQGENIRWGFNFLNGDLQVPSTYGFPNGFFNNDYIDYQSLFSTTGLVNFFNPEISYNYGLPAFRRGIDYLKTVGVFTEGRKRSISNNSFGQVGLTFPLGHTFQDPVPSSNNDLNGYRRYRPRIGATDGNTWNFFNFPGQDPSLSQDDRLSRSNRNFETKALGTARLGQLGNQTSAQDLSNPQGAAFNLPEAYEAIEGYRILDTNFPFRNLEARNVNGMDVWKGCFQSGNPFGYFLRYTRLAKEGKSAVISMMSNHRDPNQYFGRGLFVGNSPAFDVTNPNGLVYSLSYTLPGNEGSAFIVEHVRRLNSQYGGNGPDALFSNTFITCSDLIQVGSTNPNPIRVFQGDTFVAMFEFLKNFWNNYYTNNTDWQGNGETEGVPTYDQAFNGSNSSTREIVRIPVETIVNIELGSGTTISEGAQFGNTSYRVQEYPDYLGIGNDTSNNRSQFFHQYDGVYSEENVSKQYVTLSPSQLNIETDFDVRTHYSATKTLGESRDSWADFALADYKDLDPQYGSINRLINFRDNIYAFQDRAVGAYLINSRELLTGEQGATLSIGTGQGIQEVQYISTEFGCIHQFAITKTDSGIYFVDALRQKFLLVGEQLTDLSEIFGMNDYLRTNINGELLLTKAQGGDNSLLHKGIHTVYDPLNKEIWVTTNQEFRPTTPEEVYRVGGFTLCFSEPLKAFSSFYSHIPTMYLQGTRKILSPNPNNLSDLYMHDTGDYGVFYDLDPAESSITIRVNSIGVANKILRFVEYNAIVKDPNNAFVQDQALTSIEINNDYQSSGKVSLADRQKRRFRKWRIKLPRDINSQDSLGRFRGTYFDVTLYFDNSVNLSLMLERIISYFDVHIY